MCTIDGYSCYSVYTKGKIVSRRGTSVKGRNLAVFYFGRLEICVRNFRPIVINGEKLAVGHIGFSSFAIFSFLGTR